jgi:ABC-type branched-subunit amino acid transport system permease subunit
VGTFLRTIILGLISGSVFALASTGLVLTYKASGVLNFGYGALAMFNAFLYWQMSVEWGWPVWLAALVVVALIAPLIGIFLDTQLFSRLHGQPMIISIIATVGLIVLLQGTVNLIWGGDTKSVPSLFPSGTVELPGGVRIGLDELAGFFVATIAAGALGAMFRFTRVGVAFRAVVDNRPVADLMAINSSAISALAWALGTAFAGLTGILLASSLGLLDPLFLPFFVISVVFGAAIFGYMRSLPLAYAGGFVLGVAQALLRQYWDDLVPAGIAERVRNVDRAIPFIIVVVAVLMAPRALRLAGQGTSFVVRFREVSTTMSVRARAAVVAAVFGTLAIVPATGSLTWVSSMTRSMALAIIFLSIVILTGYSGQISLGHSAFMGIAAFSAAHFVGDLGAPVWLAMVAGVLCVIPAGALIGVVAVRLHGLFLALMTLGFAYVADEMFFNQNAISGGFSGISLPRPEGASSDTAFYYVALVALVLASLLAVNLRSGRTGRILAAMRDSETATRAVGVNTVLYKVVIFSLSAALAGLGAILHAQITEVVGQRDAGPFISLFYVALVVVGGIFHVGGALVSGMLFGIYELLFRDVEIMSRIQFILFGLGATLALAQNPEGMFGELRRGAAAIAKLARRRPPAASPAPVTGGQE